MKVRKTVIVEIAKIIVDCIIIPLYFIKFFCDEAVLPGLNENGESFVYTNYHYYSIFYKINREGLAYLLWCAIAIIALSIALSVLSMIFKENKALKIASYIVFGIAIILFFVLLFIAASISYGY